MKSEKEREIQSEKRENHIYLVLSTPYRVKNEIIFDIYSYKALQSCEKMHNDDLITAVFPRNPVWDRKDKNYHNRVLVEKLWEEIGQESKQSSKYDNFFYYCRLLQTKLQNVSRIKREFCFDALLLRRASGRLLIN